MTQLGEGWSAYGLLLLAGFFASEPWRWLGVVLSKDLNVESEAFRFARAVSTALVAGLVARIVIFPTGELANISIYARVGAFLGGIVVYFLTGRIMAIGVAASVAMLIAGHLLLS